jgi:hypothetical protein
MQSTELKQPDELDGRWRSARKPTTKNGLYLHTTEQLFSASAAVEIAFKKLQNSQFHIYALTSIVYILISSVGLTWSIYVTN